MLSILGWPLVVWGQAKIAIVNIQEAIGGTAEGKKAFSDLQRKYQPRQQELQRQQQEIQALQDQLQKQAATLSEDEQRRLTRELEEKQKLFKRATEDANSDYQNENQDAFRRLVQKMLRIINDYAQQNGYVLVLDSAQTPIYYADRQIDITEEMVKRYDAVNPVADAAAATSGAAPAAAGTRPGGTPARPAQPATADKPKP